MRGILSAPETIREIFEIVSGISNAGKKSIRVSRISDRIISHRIYKPSVIRSACRRCLPADRIEKQNFVINYRPSRAEIIRTDFWISWIDVVRSNVELEADMEIRCGSLAVNIVLACRPKKSPRTSIIYFSFSRIPICGPYVVRLASR